MLKLEISLPEQCHERSKVLELCAEIGDDTIYIRLKACAHCRRMFLPIRAEHRFCYRGNCRRDFHNAMRHNPSQSNPSH